MSDKPFFSAHPVIRRFQYVFVTIVLVIAALVVWFGVIVNPYEPNAPVGTCFHDYNGDPIIVYSDHVDRGLAAAGCR
jgi:hypothetical protein